MAWHDGLTLMPWRNGHCATSDVQGTETVVDPGIDRVGPYDRSTSIADRLDF